MLQTLQTEIVWNAECSPSAIHAALAIVAGKTLPEPALHQSMLVPAALLQDFLTRMTGAKSACAAKFANQLLSQSARIGNNHELAELALRKTMGLGASTTLKTDVTHFIASAERAFNSHYPEWRTIAGVFNQKQRLDWNVYGRPLLKAAGFLTDESLIPSSAEFVPLYRAGLARPYVDILSNIVLFEYDESLDDLTSGMKMVWLTLLLNLELDQLNGGMQRDTAVEIGRMAMVPVVMHAAAGEYGTPCDQTELDRLLTAWNVRATASTQETLLKWWDVYSSRRPAWQTAMNGLEQLLKSHPTQDVT